MDSKKNNLSLQEINENLSKEVSYLKNKSEILEKENKNNKNEINILKNDIFALKEENKKRDLKINELLNWKNEMKEKEKKKNTFTFDSKIITKKEELNLITNRIKNIDYFRNKEISYELII